MQVVKDMALTPADFLRDLDRALPGLDYRVDGTRVEVGDAERGLSITLRELEPRRLSGLLSLPRCEIAIAFRGYEAAERDAFLAHFYKAYQRGGG